MLKENESKALILTSSDSPIEIMVNEIVQVEKNYEERMEFIRRQADQAKNEASKKIEEVRDKIVDRLKQLGHLPNTDKPFNPDTHHICIRDQEGVILLHTNQAHQSPLIQMFNMPDQ